MNTFTKKTAVVATLFAAAMVVGPVAQASTVAAAGDVVAAETQTFRGSFYGSDKKRATNQARDYAFNEAAYAGYIPAQQCVTTHTDQTMVSVGSWFANVVISCTKP